MADSTRGALKRRVPIVRIPSWFAPSVSSIGRVMPLEAAQLIGGNVPQCGAIGQQRIGRALVAAQNVRASVDRADPSYRRAVSVGRRRQEPWRLNGPEIGQVAGQMFRHPKHLVVLVGNHLVGLNKLVVLLNQLGDFRESLGVDGRIEHRDSKAELGACQGCAEHEAKAQESDDNPFFHGWSLS